MIIKGSMWGCLSQSAVQEHLPLDHHEFKLTSWPIWDVWCEHANLH